MKNSIIRSKKSRGLIAMALVLLVIVLTFVSIQNNSEIEDSDAAIAGICPASVEPGFILSVDDISTGVVGSGEVFDIDSIDGFDFQVLQNKTSDIFSGTVKLKLNDETLILFTGKAELKSLVGDEVETGNYSLEAYIGTTLCGKSTIAVKEGPEPTDIPNVPDVSREASIENSLVFNEIEEGEVLGSNTPSTCQARFSIKLKNKPASEPLTQKGSYEISMIEEVSFVVVKNMQTDPPKFIAGKVTLKKPSAKKVKKYTGGEPRIIADFEKGKYILKAYKGDKLCSTATLTIKKDTTISNCTTFKPIAGFYRTVDATTTFVKEGEFTHRSEFKYTVVNTEGDGVVSDIPSTEAEAYFKGKIVLKVDDAVVDVYLRKRVEPTSLPSVQGKTFTVEGYDARTDELCSSSTITFVDVVEPPEPSGIICGALDSDDNQFVDVFDLANFARKYGRECADNFSEYSNTHCGAKDSNQDSKIDITDLSWFGKVYLEPSCGRQNV